jgi:hypothetical protein
LKTCRFLLLKQEFIAVVKRADVVMSSEVERKQIEAITADIKELEDNYLAEKKTKKRDQISAAIGEKTSEKNTLEAVYGEKVFQADAKELDFNDAQLSTVMNEVRTYSTDYLLDENYIKANYLLQEAEKQRKQAEELVFKAQSAASDEEKAQLYTSAHQANTAALENQREALQFLEEMRSPGYTTQYVDDSLVPKDLTSATPSSENTSASATTSAATSSNSTTSSATSSDATNTANTNVAATTSSTNDSGNTASASTNATTNTTTNTNTTASNALSNTNSTVAANTTTKTTSSATTNSISSSVPANPTLEDIMTGRMAIEEAVKTVENNALNQVKDQQVANVSFSAKDEPKEPYEVAKNVTVVNLGSPTEFTNNAANALASQTTKSIEKIEEYNTEIDRLNTAIESTSDEKEKDKLIKQLNSIDNKRAREELRVKDDYAAASQIEIENAQSTLTVINEIVPGTIGYQKEQASSYIAAADELIKDAATIRSEAAKEKDKVEQADAFKEALSKEKMAAEYYAKATELIRQNEIEANQKAINSMEKLPSTPEELFSVKLTSEASEVGNLASEARNEAAEWLDKAALAKKEEEKNAFNAKAEIAENKAGQLEQFANQLSNQANLAIAKEAELERKERILAELNQVNTEEIRVSDTYQRYFEVQEEINAKSIDLAALEGEKKGYENLALQQEIKAKDLANKAANSKDNVEKAEWLTQARELEQMAAANRQKAADIQMTIDEIDAFLEGAIIKRNGVVFNLSEAEKENYEALSISGLDKTPVQKKAVITFGDLISGTFKPEKVENTLVVFDQNITYSDDNPIPINPGYPDGLFYKVQVGAFSKPIANDVFKGFAPITAEKLPNSNLIRYRVGYFNGFTVANDAKNQIRQMGYSDAFVVAVYNGQSVTLAEARAIERGEIPSGILATVPVSTNEVTSSSTNSTTASTSTTVTATTATTSTASNTSVTVVATNISTTVASEIEVDLGEGAARTNNADRIQGLFYTVQLGAYSKPIDANSVFNISPLVTKFVGNLYKYSTGIYRSVDDAVVRKNEVNGLGLSDAFVTVYYNGERISIERANQLIAEMGEAAYATDTQGNFKQLSGASVAVPSISPSGRYQIDLGTYSGELPVDLANAMLMIQDYVIQFENVAANEKRYYVGNFNNERDAQTVIQLYRENGVDNLSVKDLQSASTSILPSPSASISYKIFLGSYVDGNVPQGRANTFMELSSLGIVKIEDERGETYYCGNEKTFKNAQELLKEFTQRGVAIAEIRAYKDGQPIDLNEAKKLTGE